MQAGPNPDLQAQGIGRDAFYRGAIPQGHIMHTVGAIADVVLPVGAAIGAKVGLDHRFDGSYATRVTESERMAAATARADVSNIMAQIHKPELDAMTDEVRQIASNVRPPVDDLNLLRTAHLKDAERITVNRFDFLRSPSVNAETLREAAEVPASPELKLALEETAQTFHASNGALSEAMTEASTFARTMKSSGMKSLLIGEGADLVIDQMIFKDDPHSLRTVVSDVVAPLIVFAPISTTAKAAVIIGTHVVNRLWDANSKHVGEF